MRSYAGGIDDGNEYARVGNLRGVASVAADDATDSGAYFLSVFESPHQVGANVFPRVTASDRKDEDHISFIHPAAPKPIGVARFPAVIVHPRCEFGNIVRRRVCFDLSDLADQQCVQWLIDLAVLGSLLLHQNIA